MIRVRFTPSGDNKHIFGTVEVDGVDVSNRVSSVRFEGSPTNGYVLHLGIVVGKEGDDVEFVVDDESLRVDARVIRKGELIDVTALDSVAAKRLLLAG